MDVTFDSGTYYKKLNNKTCKSKKYFYKYEGFTLIELIIVLSVVGISLSLAAPMTRFVHSNKISSNMFEFIRSINLARTEAVKYNIPVTVCRTMNGKKCEGKTDIDGQKVWETGWIVFFDYNRNGKVNADKDEIFYAHGALTDGYTLRSNAKIRITFKGTGIAPGFMDTWTLCGPARHIDQARGVILAISGRIRFAKDTNNNGIKDNGTVTQKSKPRELHCGA